MPQISYESTSDELSDKERFPYFVRIVPPDRFQIHAMLAFSKYFNWTYVSFLYQQGSYGEVAFKQIKKITESNDEICLAYTAMVMKKSSTVEFEEHAEQLIVNHATVVILFMGVDAAKGILSAINVVNKRNKHFLFLGSESLPTIVMTDLYDYHDLLENSFFFRIFDGNVAEYDTYFKTLTPDNNAGNNPWFADFWKIHFNCSLENSSRLRACDSDMTISEEKGYRSLKTVGHVLDSVLTFAFAINKTIQNNCSDVNKENLTSCIKGPLLLENIKRTTFNGYSGPIEFDASGDILSKYFIDQLHKDNVTFSMKPVAAWSPQTNEIVWTGPAKWNIRDKKLDYINKAPRSTCSTPCKLGEFFIQREPKCCWECKACRTNEIVENGTKCSACPDYFWPDQTVSYCEEIVPTYLEWNNPIAISITCLSCLGITVTVLVAIFYISNFNHKLIKASSREFSFIIICGVLTGYTTVYTFIVPPTKASCTAAYFCFALSFTSIYAPLLVKTNRVYRIFECGKRSTKTPIFISRRAQLVFVVFLMMVQVII